jgi:hypothetical protein
MRYGAKPKVEQVVRECLETLSEALPGFPCVGPLQAMFCESVLSCGYDLPMDVDQIMGGRSWKSFSREEKLDCCERLTYAQPVDMLAERLDPSIPSNFEDEWKAFIENHGGDADDDDDNMDDDNDSAGRAYRSESAHGSDEKSNVSPHSMDITAVMNSW